MTVLSDNRISVRKADPIPCCIAYKSLILLYSVNPKAIGALLLGRKVGFWVLSWDGGGYEGSFAPRRGPTAARAELVSRATDVRPEGCTCTKWAQVCAAPSPRRLAAQSFLISNVRFELRCGRFSVIFQCGIEKKITWLKSCDGLVKGKETLIQSSTYKRLTAELL